MNAWLLKLLRVPPEPHPPEGSPDSIRIFRAGRNYYRWLLFVWLLSWVSSELLVVFTLVITRASPGKSPKAQLIALIVEGVVLAALLVSMFISYFMLRLNFEQRWYIVTDRSLRIRAGIWNVEELTMTFANIQDLKITSGPLQKYLGLADLEVASAGGGSPGPHGGSGHAARFAGIDNAEQVRDLIQDRLRRYRDAGLGEVVAPITPETAAQELLSETRALRISLGTG